MRVSNLFRFLFFLIVIFMFSSKLFAWDGNREGFVMGIGLGKSDLKYTMKEDSFECRSYNLNNFATDFKIGYALNNRFLIYWTSKVSWFGEEGVIWSEEDGLHTYISGVAGIGTTYFFNNSSPSAFITGCLGYANLGEWQTGKNNLGFGLTWGAGYEFAKNFCGEIDFCWGFPSRDNSDELSFKNIFTVMFMLNIMGY